jgi:L-arabinose isomerase
MWIKKPKVGLVVTYAPLEVGWDQAPQLIARAAEALRRLPIDLAPFEKPVFDISTALEAAERLRNAGIESVVWLAATWSFDSLALEFVRRCPVPLIAWGTPGMETGALCGSQQVVEVLTELRRPRAFVHGTVDDASAHAAILAFACGATARQRLAGARFGMLGHRTVGMTEVTFHEYDFIEQFGALVYYQGIDRLRAAMDQADETAASRQWERVKARCGACRVSDACGLAAMRCYAALREWIERETLAGVAVGCYPDLMGIVCLACGLLAEEGIVTSCEGDMNSLALTGAMQVMSGRPVHNTDLLFADPVDNTCTMGHCGNSAVSLAASEQEVALDHVRLLAQGVVALYPGAPGRVTLANLCGRKGTYRLTWYTGEAVPTPMVFPGIPVKVRLDVPVERFLSEVASVGAGHHWMVAYGDLAPALAAFAQIARLNTH